MAICLLTLHKSSQQTQELPLSAQLHRPTLLENSPVTPEGQLHQTHKIQVEQTIRNSLIIPVE